MGELSPSGAPPSVWTMGDRLRKARLLTGLSQGAFAAELGVSRGTVSNYERSRTTRRRLLVVRTWALATGMSVEWLQGTEDVADEEGQTA